MNICSSKHSLSGSITVPGSKSHTIRALILASLAEGVSKIHNPLPSADCLSTAGALSLIGAEVELNLTTEGEPGSDWFVQGAGKNIHLPDDVVNVGNSGSLLYFLSPIASTFKGWSVFTGDESIRKRPVAHVADVLCQMGANAFTAIPGSKNCPLIIQGPVKSGCTVNTDGTASSQYISGLMMAALRMDKPLEINLSDPKETPYLVMTQKWLEKIGAKVEMSSDFKHIKVQAPSKIESFECTVPSDWEAVAFPLVAALISGGNVCIENIDGSGTQGDDAIVDVLKSIGADINWDKGKNQINVTGKNRLTTERLEGGVLHVNLSGYPDAICALAVAACFTEGTVSIEDIAVCRRKETDRIKVLKCELEKLGAVVEEGEDFMVIHGHSPYLADGKDNPDFVLHGGEVESYNDHRVAMSLACLGLGLPKGMTVIVKNAECCAVSFPRFFEVMNSIGADFTKSKEVF